MEPTGAIIGKDPNAANWPRGVDWTDYLAAIGAAETVTVSTWTVSGPDAVLTADAGSIVVGGKQTQVRLSAGTVGALYTVTNRITTSSGVIDDGSFLVLIEQA